MHTILDNLGLAEPAGTLSAFRSYLSDFTIGIVSGVITGLLIFLFSRVWQRVVVPWYEERLYNGVDVSGDWTVTHEGTEKDHEWSHTGSLSLKQSAHRLSGTLSLIPVEGAEAESRTLTFTGEVADRFVWGRLRHTSRARVGQVVVLGQVAGDGRRIVGRQIHHDIYADRIDSVPVTYSRRTT